jgi:plasmid stabilization system protein ParE
VKLTWTARAIREFEEAFAYLFEARPDAAVAWRDDVQQMMAMVENHPQIGNPFRTDPDGEIRQVLVGRYRFIYRFNRETLEMRRVWHVRRDFNRQVIRDGGSRRGWPAFIPY